MKKSVLVLLALMLAISNGEMAINRYLVYFTDKPEYDKMTDRQREQWVRENYNPEVIERRSLRGNGKVWDIKDFPVSKHYINKIEDLGVKVHHILKWENAISVIVENNEILEKIKDLEFVYKIEKVKSFMLKKLPVYQQLEKTTAVPEDNLLGETISFIGADTLHQLGLNGEGIIIGVFDTGFDTNHPVLRNIRSKLIGQYDFVDNDDDVSGFEESHGTITSSVIGGIYSDSTHFYSGLAIDASFILCRTEYVAQEVHAEEDNWAAAAEYAESLGVDLISTSLGYSLFDTDQGDYSYEDMDGNTTIITRAANALTERGVVVVVSAGNEGTNSWHYITAPADGQEVISVGAIGLDGRMASFSSYGPTFDGRVKPEIVSPGVSIPGANYNEENSSLFVYASGTSMACPVAAGGIALILQAFPQVPVSTLRTAIIETAEITGIEGANIRPGEQYGYGILNLKKVYDFLNDTSVIQTEISLINETLIGPNPFNISSDSRLTLAINNTIPLPATIVIFNVLGQKMMEFNTVNYATFIPADQFRNFNAGIYFLKIEGRNYKKISKMVITR